MMNTSTKIATLNSLPANNNQCGLLKLNIHTATGGHIEINMPEKETVSSLKWRLSRKLKISSEKMSLLFKDRPLKEGSLQDNLVTDNSKILLLPNMESGMTFQRPDVGVIQGLENLTESQVNDFLSGRAPLLLVMKLGDHMMFVQLQLSTASCGQGTQTNRSQCTVDAKEKAASTGPVFNSAALAELGHNLSQKLREFSQLSTHQKVSEHCTTATPTPSPAGPTPSAYSVSKNGTANGPVTHTQPPTPVNNNNNSSSSSTTTTNNNNNSNISSNSNSNISSNSSNNNNNSNSSNNNNNNNKTPNNMSMASSSSCSPSIPCATTTTSGSASASRTCPTTGEPIPGAIIESMHHIGQGVYSGTFSGTLDPSLQDMDGKPKRNIGTIIHILNDLLGATPQYRPQNVPHTAEKPPIDSCSHKNSEPSPLPISLSEEDNALRGKVKDLQMKMEEKRMRRQARREAKAPYQCPGSRSNSNFNIPSSTTITFAATDNTDHTSSADTCSTDSDLSVFAPQHPSCTVTDMEIGDETMTDGDGKNREIEMTAMPTPTTATTTASSATASTNGTSSSLEQESVLV